MCDKKHFEELEDRVDEHEGRIVSLEKTDSVHDAKFSMLIRMILFQMVTVWAAFFILLLSLVWGAIGPEGFNAVTKAADKQTQTIIKGINYERID